MRVAILLLEVEKDALIGGGGAERFFSDFFDIYNNQVKKKNSLYFLTDKNSNQEISSTNRLLFKKNVLKIKLFNNRYKYFLEWLQILLLVVTKRIDLIHIALYNKYYNDYIRYFNWLPSFLKPAIVVQIVDPQVPHVFMNKQHPRHYEYQDIYGELFSKLRFEGIYSWYMLFKDYFDEENRIKCKPYIEAVKSRFSNGNRYVPMHPKKKEIVWAARLVENKAPLFFVETIHQLHSKYPALLKEWKVRMFGKGNQKEDCIKLIEKYGLQNVLSLSEVKDMKDTVGYSKCFVSTQDFENFPSQSMNEALAAGNAIVSRNVGQTYFFVKDGINGVLAKQDSPEGLADALKYYLEHEELHETMEKESVKLTKEVHTPENFIRDIDTFWQRFK